MILPSFQKMMFSCPTVDSVGHAILNINRLFNYE